jgi:hypothetical protein
MSVAACVHNSEQFQRVCIHLLTSDHSQYMHLQFIISSQQQVMCSSSTAPCICIDHTLNTQP